MKKDFETKSKFNIYTIVVAIVLCMIALTVFSTQTLSWFMDESTTSNGEPDITLIGTLDLDITTNFKFKNLSLAPDTIYTLDQDGQDISTYLKTSDNHNIDGAYVRIKFTTTRKDPGTDSFVDNKDLFDLYFDSNLTTNTTYSDAVKNKWFFNVDDGYYYFIGGIYSTNIMFNKGYKTTNLMQNTNADAEVTIKFQVETVQRQYSASVDLWNTAPQIFKSMAEIESLTRVE